MAGLERFERVAGARGEVDDVACDDVLRLAVDGESHPSAHLLDDDGAGRGMLREDLAGVEAEDDVPQHLVVDDHPRCRGGLQDRQFVENTREEIRLCDGRCRHPCSH